MRVSDEERRRIFAVPIGERFTCLPMESGSKVMILVKGDAIERKQMRLLTHKSNRHGQI